MAAVRMAERHGGFTDDELWEIAVDCAFEKKGRPFTKWRD
jgi:hypothetical protein